MAACDTFRCSDRAASAVGGPCRVDMVGPEKNYHTQCSLVRTLDKAVEGKRYDTVLVNTSGRLSNRALTAELAKMKRVIQSDCPLKMTPGVNLSTTCQFPRNAARLGCWERMALDSAKESYGTRKWS
jgi:signal recognition particle GTPase